MAQWKKDIRNLSRDFCIKDAIYKRIMGETEILANEIKRGHATVPSYYKGDGDKYLYDKAYQKLRPYIFAI